VCPERREPLQKYTAINCWFPFSLAFPLSLSLSGKHLLIMRYFLLSRRYMPTTSTTTTKRNKNAHSNRTTKLVSRKECACACACLRLRVCACVCLLFWFRSHRVELQKIPWLIRPYGEHQYPSFLDHSMVVPLYYRTISTYWPCLEDDPFQE